MKFKEESDHKDYLRKLFTWLCKYNLKLNPTKFTYSVKSDKLLDLLINNQGIELDVAKIKAITEMLTT